MTPDSPEEPFQTFDPGTSFNGDMAQLEEFISRHLSAYVQLDEAYRSQQRQALDSLERGTPPFTPIPDQPPLHRRVSRALHEWVLAGGFTHESLYLAAFQNQTTLARLQQEVEELRQQIQQNRQRMQSATIETNLN